MQLNLSSLHTNFNMLVSFVDEPLINLVAEAKSIMFNAEVSNHLQLVSGENLQEEDSSRFLGFFFQNQ